MSQKEIQELLDKAHRSLLAAEILYTRRDYDFAVSRAYYGMFYAAQALLLSRDIRRSKHSAIIAAFNEQFVKSGEVPTRLFQQLRDGFEDRVEGDYGLTPISADQAKAGIVAAIRQRHERGQVIYCTGVIADRPQLYDAARRYFGGWSQALRAAGFDPHQVRRKPPPWTAPMVIADLRRRAKTGTPAPAISFIQPVSLVRACITFFGSLEAAATAARVDTARIGYRRSSGRKRRRYRGGQANA